MGAFGLVDLLLVMTLGAQAGVPGLSVEKVWTAEEMSGDSGAGKVSIAPDPSRSLIVLDVKATGSSPLTIRVDQLIAEGGGVRTGPVGAAPVAPSNFDSFIGFGSGWRTARDAQNREVKIGRDNPQEPIRMTVAPGAILSIVYIVPKSGPPLTVSLPGAGPVTLIVK